MNEELFLGGTPVGIGAELPPIFTDPNIQWMGNPAAENCITKGGTIVTERRKVEYYVLPDGSTCEVSDAKNCVAKGGKLVQQDADFSDCVFPDGSRCEEWAFFRGQCAPGDSLKTSSTNENITGLILIATTFVVTVGAIVYFSRQ